ncbi:hypothetical protein BELL_0318g00110 [Botrytis elliptica]|uniref:Major facilitator superfamily (MFS) profile domain-containing protein n=1 Tax=Botrytis elliptica TaxID=278938 RepID=A0A4Z1JKH1_9HELO|nr:hypothetical protein EAE99_002948 [Botrytis elliptica]TGO73966.1 hypothetical protein BELL_0318g00110 [Botrytis elliptica]
MPHQAADLGAHNSDQITDHESANIATTVGIAEFRDEAPPRKFDEKLSVDAGIIADKIEVKVQLEEQALVDPTLEGWRFQDSFFTGAAMKTVIINLPQRFQAVNGNSPLEAGYRLLALTISIPFGSFIDGVLVQKLCILFIWVLMGFAPLQIAGLVLLDFSSSNKDIPNAIYGYQVVAGLGLGGSLGVSIMMIPFIATKQDMDFEDQRVIQLAAVGMSGAGQFRALGRSIGIAISTNVINDHITSALASILSLIQLNQLLQSAKVLTKFPPRLLAITRKAYSDAYNTQMFVLAAFSAASLMNTVLFWEKTPRRMTKS